MSRRGEHLIFCLFPEFRHLSIIQISFCRTKTCNQNAVTALLYVSHMKCQQRQLSPASLSEDTQREGGGGGVGDITKYILHNSLAMKVLAAFSWPIFKWKCVWEPCNMLKLLLLLWSMKWAQSSPTELDHVVGLAPHTFFHLRWTWWGGCAFRYFIQLRGWHIWTCEVAH